ncbi:SDR family NAD(P)-dependent oxidoreductase [Subtercola sp. YIM 133946]|uniref:SDR family NAD(P)-dependent oxidoreductase n=1 Tax=Subtercola sp. YIM 133946 TaxID=3118909 RepID=UPI002F938562
MSVLLIVGYGPGISQAVANRYAGAGYSLGLVARDADKLADAVDRFAADGTTAAGQTADAGDPAALRKAVGRIRADLGPITAVLWTAFRGTEVGNVLEARPEDIEGVFDIGVTGLLACVHEVLDDLKAAPGASILVANGALGENTSELDRVSVFLGGDGVALQNAAKSKLVGLLAERLREFDIYVGEVTIAGSVAGTATESPGAIDPARIADRLWSMAEQRDTTRVRLTE